MAKARMGWEGKIFYGGAGSTATQEIEQSRDINYEFDTDDGDTTVRGAGTAPPIETGSVTARKASITWQMPNRDSDTILTALLTAAFLGNPVALRTKDKAAGKGYDGDAIIKVKHAKPLRGEQMLEFSAKPNDDNRAPQLYV